MTQDFDNKKDEQALDKAEEKKGPRDWKSIAEVRMVLYVVPVALVFLLIAWLMSQFAN